MPDSDDKEISYRGVTVRDSKYPESYDEYLETIYRLSLQNPMGWVKNKDISERLEVKAPSVSNMLDKLSKADLIQWKPRKGIRLSDQGRERAKQIVTYHVLMELFLSRILGMEDPKKINKIACDFEHHMTPDFSNRLIDLLGLDEEIKNIDNFIYEDRFPRHLRTQTIYTKKEVKHLLNALKNQIFQKISQDSNKAKISQYFDDEIATLLNEK